MKLNEKVVAVGAASEMPHEQIGQRQAERLFAKAVNESGAYLQHLRMAKDSYVDCCFDFFIARFGFDHGQWGAQCGLYEEQISERTIQRRVADAEIMVVYAREKFKGLKTIAAIREKYKDLPLPAVRAMVQDMRDCGIARKFGEYYAEDYLQKKKAKLLGAGQMEFDYRDAADTLQLLCKADLPKDLHQAEELAHFTKLAAERVAKWVKELKSTWEVA